MLGCSLPEAIEIKLKDKINDRKWGFIIYYLARKIDGTLRGLSVVKGPC